MKQRYQKVTVIIIIAIICISLIGSSFVAIFGPDDNLSQENQNREILQKEYDSRKAIVSQLQNKLSQNPGDTEIQLSLADAYFDKSRISGQLDQNEYTDDLKQAIEIYQRVLEKKEDTAVMYRLGVSAFLIGENELSENTYKLLLSKEPQNADGLYGYGMLLFYNLKDYKQAEEKWTQGLNAATNDEQKKRFEEMLSLVKVINANANESKNK